MKLYGTKLYGMGELEVQKSRGIKEVMVSIFVDYSFQIRLILGFTGSGAGGMILSLKGLHSSQSGGSHPLRTLLEAFFSPEAWVGYVCLWAKAFFFQK
jgi:hypothetical protein